VLGTGGSGLGTDSFEVPWQRRRLEIPSVTIFPVLCVAIPWDKAGFCAGAERAQSARRAGAEPEVQAGEGEFAGRPNESVRERNCG
jgi:hypothetical protein